MKKIISILTLLTIAFGGFSQNILVPNRNMYHPDGEEYVLLSPTGKVIKTFKNIEIKGDINDGLIAAMDNSTKKLGYLSAVTGEWAIQPQWENPLSHNSFSEGLAVIRVDKNSDSQCAVIDKTGKMIVPFTTWGIEKFSDGLAVVSQFKDGVESSGAIDKTGKLVIPFSVGHIDIFKDGLALKMNEKSKQGYIDKTGNWVIQPQWEDVKAFSEGLAVVSLTTENAKYGYIDKKGQLVIKYQYETAESFKEGFAAVGFMEGKGDDAIVKKSYIDKTGKRLTKQLFDEAQDFNEGLAMVKIDTKDDYGFGAIDKTGKLVVPATNHVAGGYDIVIGYSEGLCPVENGYMDTKGKLITAFPPKTTLANVTMFKNGLATCAIYEGDDIKFVLLDKTGKVLWKSVANQSLCFPAGVYVSMADGSRKKIENIKSGDKVIDLNNKLSVVEALETHNGNFTIGALGFNMPENVDFVTNGDFKNTVLLEATLNHPLSINGKKVPLKDVKAGDEVLQIIDNQVVKTKVAFVEKECKTVSKVYNLKTNGKGYFVNGYGVLVK